MTKVMMGVLEVGRLEAFEVLEENGLIMSNDDRVQFIAQAQAFGELLDDIDEKCNVEENIDDGRNEGSNSGVAADKRRTSRPPLSNRTR